MIPPLFVLGLLLLLASFAVLRLPWLLAPVALYLGLVAFALVSQVPDDPLASPVLALVFPCIHVGYGLGFLAGMFDTVVFAAFNRSSRGAVQESCPHNAHRSGPAPSSSLAEQVPLLVERTERSETRKIGVD
jgi:hypothetical protein